MIFNNPHFNNQIATNTSAQNSENDPHNKSNQSNKSRPSVQDIMNKYDSRVSQGQGARFTFQAANQITSPERQTFGQNQQQGYRLSLAQKKEDQPRDSNAMILKSIDESNLSKVLSEFSIVSEAQDIQPAQNNIFNNPFTQQHFLMQEQTDTRKPKEQERFTFGDGVINTYSNILGPALQQSDQKQQYDYPEDTPSYLGENELFDDMSVLRDKVLELLQTYSNDIKSNKDPKIVKQQVQKDALIVSQKYNQIIDRVNQTDISAFTNMSLDQSKFPNPKKEQELNMMFNLVDDFLRKFDSNKEPINYSRLIEQKSKANSSMSGTKTQGALIQHPPLPPSVIRQPQPSSQQSNVRLSERTITTQQQNQTNYQQQVQALKQSQQVSQSQQEQLQQMKLTQQSTTQPQNQVQNYQQQYQTANQRTTYPQQQPQTYIVQQGYRQSQPLNNEMDISVMPQFPVMDDSFYSKTQITEDKLHSKLVKLKSALENQLEQSNLPYTKNILIEMIQNLNNILQANDIQTVKTVVFKIEQAIKQMNTNDSGSLQLFNYMAKAIKATQKRINFIEQNTETRPSEEIKLSKRRFFDLALKAKSLLPQNHNNRLILVSVLFEEFQKQGLPENMMESFVNQKILK